MGIELEDGAQARADHVISAANGYSTIFQMLDGRFLNDELRHYYNGGLRPWPGLVQVSLGVARSFPHDTQILRFHSRKPIMAPEGKAVVEMTFPTDYAYWKGIADDKVRYKAEKERIAEQVIETMDDRYPGFKSHRRSDRCRYSDHLRALHGQLEGFVRRMAGTSSRGCARAMESAS